jgi:hypothetical protein
VLAVASPTATPVATTTQTAPITETATPAPEPTEEAADMGEEFVPPNNMPTTGDVFEDEFLPPPSLLPETGADYSLPQTLPDTGVGLLLPLLGVGFGGLAFTLHHLRRRRF